jgi:hypothetical protein
MLKRLATTCAALVLEACVTTAASQQPAPGAAPAAAARERLAVTNNSPFDLAVCGRPALELEPLSEEVVMGALLARGPSFQECFLEPKSSQGTPADVTVKVTVADSGVTVTIGGTGLTDAGKACLEAAAKAIPFPALPAGTPAVSGQIRVAPGVKPIEWGNNVADDMAGTIRLALPSMCSCFTEFGDAAPPQPVLKLRLTPTAPPDVLVEGVAGHTGVAACLGDKVKALALPRVDVDLEMGLPLILVNGWSNETTAGAAPTLEFQQLEARRARQTAEVLIAAGRRGVAAMRYDEVVKKYKARPTPSLIGELEAKCAAVLAGDDAHLAALKALLASYQAEVQLVTAAKAKDPAWARVEPGLQQQLAKASGEVARVEQQKLSDAAACPKSK